MKKKMPFKQEKQTAISGTKALAWFKLCAQAILISLVLLVGSTISFVAMSLIGK